jgi:hypothetical protein
LETNFGSFVLLAVMGFVTCATDDAVFCVIVAIFFNSSENPKNISKLILLLDMFFASSDWLLGPASKHLPQEPVRLMSYFCSSSACCSPMV